MADPIPDHVITHGLHLAVALGLVSSWSAERTDGDTLASSPRRYSITWPSGRTDEVGAGFAFAYGRGVADVLAMEGQSWPSL